MARKRMIDPSFWSDEQLGTCNLGARFLFMGLISQADDDGRLNGHPSLVKSLIYPYDTDITPEIVDEWLETLAERNLIIRYVVNNQKYIFVRNFKKHQTINKPVKSKLPEPPPDEDGRTTVGLPEEGSITPSQEKRREEKGREEEGKRTEEPASLILSWINQYRLDIKGAFQLDEICSYHGFMDIEVIEHAIKQSEGKSVAYAMSILDRCRREAKTTKESIRQHIQAVPKQKVDKDLEARQIEIARNKWIAEGNDPNDFEYRPASNA